jgi:hypothetical protein
LGAAKEPEAGGRVSGASLGSVESIQAELAQGRSGGVHQPPIQDHPSTLLSSLSGGIGRSAATEIAQRVLQSDPDDRHVGGHLHR